MTLSQPPIRSSRPRKPRRRIFMMDLLATVPYYTSYLSRALLAAGADVMVGSISYYLDPDCFSSRDLKLEPGLIDAVGRFRRLPSGVRRGLKLIETSINLSALALRFLLRPPAVVHVQYLPMLRLKLPLERWFLALCRRRGVPVVLTVHDLLPHDTANRYRRTFTALYGSMDGLICHSDHVRTRLVEEFGVPAEKITVIAHGPFFYDLAATHESATPVIAGEVHVLWQGIIFPYKGVDVLLRAWQQVQAEVPAARLLVLGTGAEAGLTQLRLLAEQLGVERVTLDFRFTSAEELVAAYRAADIVVYPYHAITTSGALATGLALGKTIVASDLPVFRELLHDRQNALLCPAGDAASLAAAISLLARNRPMREHLAAEVRAMEFGERSWRTIARQTLQVYRDLGAEVLLEESR